MIKTLVRLLLLLGLDEGAAWGELHTVRDELGILSSTVKDDNQDPEESRMNEHEW